MRHSSSSNSKQTLSLIDHFKAIPDPRLNRTKNHELIDILVISICTLLCGGESFNDMEDFGHAKLDWFKTFLTLRNGVPSHDTFNRVFSMIKPEDFLKAFLEWTQSMREAVDQEIVAMDGKALRRALNKDQGVQYIVSAWAQSNGMSLGQLKVSEKSNEITAVPQLLRLLELKGCIVTLDAMGCQKKIAKEIVNSNADYVLALKGNHEKVHEEVKKFIDAAIVEKLEERGRKNKGTKGITTLAMCETAETNHGRIEIRRYYQSIDLEWFGDLKLWEGLKSVGMVESTRECNGKQSVERRYFLSSLPLNVELFARAVRGHWAVENNLHWVMDVCFREDQSRARVGYAAENLASLRRLALNLLKREKTKKRGIRGKQLNAGWDHTYLLRLLAI